MQIRPALNIDAVVSELAASQQMAENDIKSTDEILGLIDAEKSDGQDEGQSNLDELLNDQPDDAPIWDTFMGNT